jgi:hemerythrin superfamily protein
MPCRVGRGKRPPPERAANVSHQEHKPVEDVFNANIQQENIMAEQEAIDAVALLKKDHRTVEELFAKFENASGDGRKEKIANEICLELSVHAMIEEEIFYPACEGQVEEDLIKEAYVEHDGAKVLIGQIIAGGPDDEYYDAKVKVLQEQIEHHVEEEEKRMEGMFSQARKAGLDMDKLGADMAARKAELTAEFQANGVPQPQLTTMEPTA